MFTILGITIGILVPLLNVMFPEGLGWWWLIAAPLMLLVSGILNYALELLEWLVLACWKKCPNCGARRWSGGFTRGMGL